MGELAQPLTGCSTWESGSQALTGQRSGTGSNVVGAGELGPKTNEWGSEACLLPVVHWVAQQ